MTPKEFFDKVVEMRAAQKEYFRCRTSAALSKSKRLEAEIDREIKRAKIYYPKRRKPASGHYSAKMAKIINRSSND